MSIEADLTAFLADWTAQGRARSTAVEYARVVRRWGRLPTLPEARARIAELAPRPVARHEARALKAYSRWLAAEYDEPDVLAKLRYPKDVAPAAPPTITKADVERLLAACDSTRDRAIIQVLWDTGLRRSELAAIQLSHVNLQAGLVVIPQAKTGPRVVPLATTSTRALRRYLRHRGEHEGSLFGLTGDGVRQVIRRRGGGALGAHSFRRGFAVRWLTEGGSQASLQTIAGWSSGAMVTRYVRACSAELALDEARRLLG